MRTIWHSLAWKEWHEHKWKLVSIAAILWGVTSLVLLNNEIDSFGLAAASLVLCIIPLAVFIGLGAAASERSRNTLPFLQALPTPMWRVALCKIAFGLLSVTIPIILTVALFYLWSQGLSLLRIHYRDPVPDMGKASITGNWYLDIILYSTPIAASLFVWAAAAGVNRKDEVSAGAVALAAMVGWLLLLALIGYLLIFWTQGMAFSDQRFKWLAVLGLLSAPGGLVTAADMWRDSRQYLSLGIFTAAITHLALATWYVRRFGQIANLEIRSPQVAVPQVGRPAWLAPPRHSALTAIAWKQFRESGPLVLAGLAGVVGIVTLFLVGDPKEYLSRPGQLAELFAGVSASLGFGVAMIVGIGVCLYDVGPQLNTFWRSRPVNPDLWFWGKFLTGLSVLLAALYVPLISIVYVAHPDPSGVFFSHERMMIPTVHISIFAAAVAMTCLVRHAVYAAILSIPLLYLGVVVVWIVLKLANFVGWIGNLRVD